MSKKKPDWEVELAEYFDKHGERREVDIVKALVARYRCEYENTDNPLAVWFAYAECRQVNLDIPEWIFRYLDRVAGNFWHLCPGAKNPVPDKPSPAIAEALEMKGAGKSGPGNVFKAFQNVRHLAMAHDLIRLILSGHKETVAADQVAEQRGVSRSTILRAYKKYAWIIPHPKKTPLKK